MFAQFSKSVPDGWKREVNHWYTGVTARGSIASQAFWAWERTGRKKIWTAHSLLLQFMTKDGELHTHTCTQQRLKQAEQQLNQANEHCYCVLQPQTQAECWHSRCVDPLAQLRIKGRWYWLCGEQERVKQASGEDRKQASKAAPLLFHWHFGPQGTACDFRPCLDRIMVPTPVAKTCQPWLFLRDFGSQICQPLCDDNRHWDLHYHPASGRNAWNQKHWGFEFEPANLLSVKQTNESMAGQPSNKQTTKSDWLQWVTDYKDVTDTINTLQRVTDSKQCLTQETDYKEWLTQ